LLPFFGRTSGFGYTAACLAALLFVTHAPSLRPTAAWNKTGRTGAGRSGYQANGLA
jgi:hypothetical protein